MSTVHLLTNPTARAGAAAGKATEVAKKLRDRGLDVIEVVGSNAAETGVALQEAVDAGAERVIAVGGDGLVHLAVQAVAQSPAILGVVPSGTGNDFAGGLGLSSDVDGAIDAALAQPTPIDLIRIGDAWGASVATVGFSVAVNERANRMRFPRGSSRYTIATLLELPRLRTDGYELSVDGDDHDMAATLITVANTTNFGGGMCISPDARPDDGLLDVTIVGDVGRRELLTWFRKVFDGSHLDHPAVSTLRGRTITLAAGDAQVWADGEPVSPTPVTLAAVPGALLLAGVTLGT
jgi:diacylglycerol kinase (ATP)